MCSHHIEFVVKHSISSFQGTCYHILVNFDKMLVNINLKRLTSLSIVAVIKSPQHIYLSPLATTQRKIIPCPIQCCISYWESIEFNPNKCWLTSHQDHLLFSHCTNIISIYFRWESKISWIIVTFRCILVGKHMICWILHKGWTWGCQLDQDLVQESLHRATICDFTSIRKEKGAEK